MSQPTPQPDYDAMLAKIKATAEEAGLPVMEQILGIVWDREQVGPQVLADLTAADMEALYEGWVARAVDNVEDSLLGKFA